MEYSLMSSLEEGIKQCFDLKSVILVISKSLDCYINRENAAVNKEIKRLNVAQTSTISNSYHESFLSVVIKEYGDAEAKCAQQRTNLINQLQVNLQKPFVEFLKEFPPLSKKFQKLKNICSSVRNLSSKLNSLVGGESQYEIKQVKVANTKSDVSEAQIKAELESAQGEFISGAKDLKRLVFKTIVREKQLLSKLSTILEYHISYHKACADLQTNYMSKIKSKITEDSYVFGVDLNVHLINVKCEISHVVNDCICYLMNFLDTKGLFRINAQESKVRKLMAIFNTGLPITESYITDEHTVASSLKRYLILLPNPLFPFSFYNEIKGIVKSKSHDVVSKVKGVLTRLPQANYINLRYVMKFLTEVVKFSKENMMDVSNIGIVFGPCLLRQESDLGPDLSFCDKETVSLIVTNFNKIFPEDCVLNTERFYRFSWKSKLSSTSNELLSKRSSTELKRPSVAARKDYSHTPPYHFTNPSAYSELEKRK